MYAKEENFRGLVEWFGRGCEDEEIVAKPTKKDLLADVNAVEGESATARSRRLRKELEAKESGSTKGKEKVKIREIGEAATLEEYVERGMRELKAEHGEFYEISATDIQTLRAGYAAALAAAGVVDDKDSDDEKEAVWPEVKTVLDSMSSVQQAMRELNCIKDKETAIDPAVWRCRRINRLQLQMPAGVLVELPIKIQRFRQLDTLILSNNSLRTLPDSIGTLHKLRVLEVANNQLTTLPNAEIWAPVKELQILNCSGNQLTSAEFAKLAPCLGSGTLKNIAADRNLLDSLASMPWERLSLLDTLSASQNAITALPAGVSGITSITRSPRLIGLSSYPLPVFALCAHARYLLTGKPAKATRVAEPGGQQDRRCAVRDG